ncbi:MAG: hypothetical protein M1840_000664 [Geoglossum simile]|nr:MAG: hypothetical protein M1840_000664 [Geoglossum simile]
MGTMNGLQRGRDTKARPPKPAPLRNAKQRHRKAWRPLHAFLHNPANLDPVRTPPASLPPQPPAEESMREGLEGDDRYIMVEDEFHAVAKTFTKHLHHAEYVRLKQLAKSQNASKIHTISRPVDSQTKMREDTKKAKARESMSRLQKNAVRDMLLAKRGEDESDQDLSDPHEGPWAGTSLQGLMASPKKPERSLAPISGIRSNTRAAAGFTKAVSAAAQTSRFGCEVKRKPTPVFTPAGSSPQDGATASEGDADDDDLDALAYVEVEESIPQITHLCAYNRGLGGGHREDLHIKHEPPERNGGNRNRNELGAWPNASSFLPKPSVLPSEASQISAKRIAKLKAEKASIGRKDGNTSSIFEEIPTFLL